MKQNTKKHTTTRDPKSRHPDNTTITFALKRELREGIEEAAAADGRTISDWLRWTLQQMVDGEYSPHHRP
jgi:hypothetical protein